MRKILNESQISTDALSAINQFHPDTVKEVSDAIGTHEWVIVGMKFNPFVKRACSHLRKKGVQFHYIEIGSYWSKWKVRLALKLWSGWPTFPQVFHKGKLVGGAMDLIKYLP